MHDETRRVGEDLPVGGDAGALVGIAGENPVERGVRNIVSSVDKPQQQIRDPRVYELAGRAEVGGCESEDAHDAEGDGCPEEPGTELAPARVRPVGNDPHDRIEERSDEADDEEEIASLGSTQTEDIGVVEKLQGEQRLEDEVGGHVAEAVAKLLFEGKFLDHSRSLLLVLLLLCFYAVTS